MKKFLKSKRCGMAMPLAVVAIILLLAMGVGLLSLGVNNRIYSMRNTSGIKARCAADAGLTMALFEMNQKLQIKPYNEGVLPSATNVKLPYTDDVCSYKVTGDLASGYIITSTGKSGNAQRAIQATIGLNSPFDHAILTKNNLTLKSNTIVDGYNSADPLDSDIDVDIGTQSTANDSVVLNSGSIINGDVFAAPGSDLDTVIKDLGAKVGRKYTAPQEPLPAVTSPALPGKLAINITGETVTLTPDDNGTYPEIYLHQLYDKKTKTVTPSILEVSGGDVVLELTGDIQLENSCEIIVKPDSTLTIYTDGNIHARNGSSISTENPPEAADTIEIYATGQDKQFFDIKAKSEFTGVIYAPNADVDVYAKGDAYGSIVADNFNYMSGGSFFYDEALSKVTADDVAVHFEVRRWSESNVTN